MAPIIFLKWILPGAVELPGGLSLEIRIYMIIATKEVSTLNLSSVPFYSNSASHYICPPTLPFLCVRWHAAVYNPEGDRGDRFIAMKGGTQCLQTCTRWVPNQASCQVCVCGGCLSFDLNNDEKSQVTGIHFSQLFLPLLHANLFFSG